MLGAAGTEASLSDYADAPEKGVDGSTEANLGDSDQEPAELDLLDMLNGQAEARMLDATMTVIMMLLLALVATLVGAES